MKCLRRVYGRICKWQLYEGNDIFCIAGLSEGYEFHCSYSSIDLTMIDGELIPQKNPQPGADGVCRDYKGMS